MGVVLEDEAVEAGDCGVFDVFCFVEVGAGVERILDDV